MSFAATAFFSTWLHAHGTGIEILWSILPFIQKSLRARIFFEEFFSEELLEIVAIDCAKNQS